MTNYHEYDFDSAPEARAFLSGIETADSESVGAIGYLPVGEKWKAFTVNYDEDDGPDWYNEDDDFITEFAARPEHRGLIIFNE